MGNKTPYTWVISEGVYTGELSVGSADYYDIPGKPVVVLVCLYQNNVCVGEIALGPEDAKGLAAKLVEIANAMLANGD